MLLVHKVTGAYLVGNLIHCIRVTSGCKGSLHGVSELKVVITFQFIIASANVSNAVYILVTLKHQKAVRSYSHNFDGILCTKFILSKL